MNRLEDIQSRQPINQGVRHMASKRELAKMVREYERSFSGWIAAREEMLSRREEMAEKGRQLNERLKSSLPLVIGDMSYRFSADDQSHPVRERVAVVR